MAQRVILKSLRLGPKTAIAVISSVGLLFCPWIWKPLPDGYFSYSGIVIEKGTEHHFLSTRRRTGNSYVVLQAPDGTRVKKYVSDFAYAIVRPGTFVAKKRGLHELPLRPDQTDPREIPNRVH